MCIYIVKTYLAMANKSSHPMQMNQLTKFWIYFILFYMNIFFFDCFFLMQIDNVFGHPNLVSAILI